LLAEGQEVPEVDRGGQVAGGQRGDLPRWRAQYGRLKADFVRRLKELEGENARLQRIMADKELQIQALVNAAAQPHDTDSKEVPELIASDRLVSH
jgi:hypothetical protein